MSDLGRITTSRLSAGRLPVTRRLVISAAVFLGAVVAGVIGLPRPRSEDTGSLPC
ncbi:MAG: hypothetical protein ACR2HR_11450 [Euzebya sp.]